MENARGGVRGPSGCKKTRLTSRVTTNLREWVAVRSVELIALLYSYEKKRGGGVIFIAFAVVVVGFTIISRRACRLTRDKEIKAHSRFTASRIITLHNPCSTHGNLQRGARVRGEEYQTKTDRTYLHGEQSRAEHAHSVHVFGERADHRFDVLGDGGALVKIGSELVHLPFTVACEEGGCRGFGVSGWVSACWGKGGGGERAREGGSGAAVCAKKSRRKKGHHKALHNDSTCIAADTQHIIRYVVVS